MPTNARYGILYVKVQIAFYTVLGPIHTKTYLQYMILKLPFEHDVIIIFLHLFINLSTI